MFKSLELIEEIKKNCLLSKEELIEVLQNIAYFISDNQEEYGGEGARYLLEDLIETIDKDIL